MTKIEKMHQNEKGEIVLESVPFPHCPYCNYSVFGGTKEQSNQNIKQHIQKFHPEKLSGFNKLTTKIKTSNNFWWEISLWFTPVLYEMLNIRFFILWLIGTILSLITLNLFITIGWTVGFIIFGFCFATYIGVFNHD